MAKTRLLVFVVAETSKDTVPSPFTWRAAIGGGVGGIPTVNVMLLLVVLPKGQVITTL